LCLNYLFRFLALPRRLLSVARSYDRAWFVLVSSSHQCSPGYMCVFYIFLCCTFHILFIWLRNALCSVRLNRRHNVMYICSIQAVCNLCCSLYVRQPGAYYWLYFAWLGIGPWVYLLGSTLREPTSFIDYLWSTKLCGLYLSLIHICM